MLLLSRLFHHKHILINLIRNDFRTRYLGNYLGIVWAFVQPVMMLVLYWLVFTYGLRVRTNESSVPFTVWLFAGLIPWFLVSDAITSACRSVIDQSFLVKKMVFEVKLLPFIKIGSTVLVNSMFWVFLGLYLIAYGYYPTWMWLQLMYYFFCMLSFVLGLSLLLSAVMVFVLDLSQVVTMLMQIAFWATPLIWNQDLLPARFAWIVAINPFAYLINGIRDTLIYHVPFWTHPAAIGYFWGVTLLLLWMGNRVFNQLRPHFADVL